MPRTAVAALLAAALAAPLPARSAPAAAALLADARAWRHEHVLAIDPVRGGVDPASGAGDILAVYGAFDGGLTLRVSLCEPVGIRDGVSHFDRARVRVLVLLDEAPGGETGLPAPLAGEAPFGWERALTFEGGTTRAASVRAAHAAKARALDAAAAAFHVDAGWLAAALPAAAAPARVAVVTFAEGRELDRVVAPFAGAPPSGTTHVAFVHHGNQGLAYSDVFHGRAGAEAASGFDEILEVHQNLSIPGNFHLSALLQTQAEWAKNNGDPLDVNGWLRAGVTAGWAGMIGSAYGQPILPFLQGAMNDWAISRDHAMVNFRYGYDPNVAWVPERVFLDPSTYPNAGVVTWSGAHWQSNGFGAVILDDWPHCAGHNKHQIHVLQGNGLRIVPRDGDFTGRLHTGDGAGALQILVDEANSGVGAFRITVYADDWEQAAEVAGWETTFPFALDTYLWMINKCATESAWLSTWKLDPAVANPNFTGATFTPTYGTYGGIGDVHGYGGSNNAWYSNWAGYVPYSTGGNGAGGCGGGGNCRNHGQLWNDAHAALQAAPDNGIREAGWYVMMTNLHETAWHDHLGGPISGWQRRYAAHVKNAKVYAEAAHWAAGSYASTCAAYASDLDGDGVGEYVVHNDRVFGVFETIGGRLTHLFARGPGYGFSVIGVDNAYWAGTEGDYNDVNHVAGLSDVGSGGASQFYDVTVDVNHNARGQLTFRRGAVRKTITATPGRAYLDVVYRVGAATEYVQSGWTPDLVDLLYNAEMDRVWGGGPTTYMGQRNPNTGATGAYVLGGGGAHHQLDYTSTLMKVDEIRGTQKFQFYIYGGTTSPPDGAGRIAELETLKDSLTDLLAPEPVSGTWFPASRQLVLDLDEPATLVGPGVGGLRLEGTGDNTADVVLAGTLLTAGHASRLVIQVTPAKAAEIEALPLKLVMRLAVTASTLQDAAGNTLATEWTPAAGTRVFYGPATSITLDGRFDPGEWPTCTVALADSFDSQWNAGPQNVTNEIQALHATWDSTYLYLGIRGVVTGNSWLLYLDTDPGGPNGQTNLTAIDTWERGATFSAPGFKPDWQFGAYQHQGPFDSQSFFRILSATTTQSYTDSVLAAFDPAHAFGLHGGSEIAIPWNVLFGLGGNAVPPGRQLGLVASLAWDPEPNGQLGGDQAPGNLAATPPALDNRILVALDQNGDGVPDPVDRRAPALTSAAATSWDSVVTVTFDEPVSAATANQVSRWTVYETVNPAQTAGVLSAQVQPGGTTVILRVSPLTHAAYTVVAAGIADLSCYANVAHQTSAAFQGPPVAVGDAAPALGFAVGRPAPNPARGRATLDFTLPEAAHVTVALYDVEGRRVREAARGEFPAGRHGVTLDLRSGRDLAPGLYFVRVSAGPRTRVQRLVVMP